MPSRARKKVDWIQFIAPAISSIIAALVLLTVTKSCSTSDSTHSAVTTLTQHDFPLLQKDVGQTQKDVSDLHSTVGQVQKDVAEVKGTSVSKSDLESKNSGLQSQIRSLYENQNALKDKLQDIQLQNAKKPNQN